MIKCKTMLPEKDHSPATETAARKVPSSKQKRPAAVGRKPIRIAENMLASRRPTAEADPLEAGAFPIDALPAVMRNIAANIADVHQIDVALPAMAALATLAGAVGKSVIVDGAVNGWKTPVNLYVVAAAPKSFGKGAAGIVAKPLSDATKRLQTQFQEQEYAKLQTEEEVLKKKKTQLLKEFTEADEPGETALELLTDMNIRIGKIKGLLKSPPAFHTGAATGPALEEVLARNDEQIFSSCFEGGDMIRSALGKMGRQATDLFLSGYSIENSASARISRDLKNMEPCISVLWFVQPSLLRELFGSDEVLERGLSARILAFCVGHDEVPFDDGRKREIDENVFAAWCDCIDKALANRTSPRTITVHPEARELFRDWHNHSVRLRRGPFRDVQDELGRWRESSIRISGLLAVAAGKEEIDATLARAGIRICKWCVNNGLALFESGRIARLEKRKARLKELLLKGEMTLRDLKKSHGFTNPELRHMADKFPDQFAIRTHRPPGGGRPSERMHLVRKNQ